MSDTPYFTPAQARKQEKALANSATFADSDIDDCRVFVEEDLEKACHVAFTTRTTTEYLDAPQGDTADLVVGWPRVQAVTSCTIDGQALDDTDLSALVCYPDGRIYRPCGWNSRAWGRPSFVQITYQHGYTSPPGRVVRAAIKLVKRFLVASPADDRATQMVNPDGTTQWLQQAGFVNLYDVPEANAIVTAYSEGADVG